MQLLDEKAGKRPHTSQSSANQAKLVTVGVNPGSEEGLASRTSSSDASQVDSPAATSGLSLREQVEVGKRLGQKRKKAVKTQLQHSGPRPFRLDKSDSAKQDLEQQKNTLQWSLEAALKLPANSAYAKHRVSVLRKILQSLETTRCDYHWKSSKQCNQVPNRAVAACHVFATIHAPYSHFLVFARTSEEQLELEKLLQSLQL